MTEVGAPKLNKAIALLMGHGVFGNIKLDTFRGHQIKPNGELVSTFDHIEAAVWLGMQGYNVNSSVAREAVDWIANRNQFDSLKAFIEELPEWDGRHRIDSWLIDLMGASNTVANRWIGRSFLISAIARALDPGCQVDHVLVLYGMKQGEGKSRLVRTLGGPFYREMTMSVSDVDAKIQLQGAWFVEFADLGSLSRSEINAVKGFLTQQVDNFRPKYERQTTPHPRRCVFVVTTNSLDFVYDSSGARRFWPVAVKGGKPIEPELVHQLFAEARVAWSNGERWWPEGRMKRLLESLQENLQQEDAWIDAIKLWTADRQEVTVSEVLYHVFGIPKADHGRGQQMRVTHCLKLLGFMRVRTSIAGSKAWTWRRKA